MINIHLGNIESIIIWTGMGLALILFVLYKVKHRIPKKNKKATEEFFKYLKVEQTGDTTGITLDIHDEDIKSWLYAVTKTIQASLGRNPSVKNYLMGQMILGGQKIEFSLVKDFKKGPHEIRLELEKENEKLKEYVKELEAKISNITESKE